MKRLEKTIYTIVEHIAPKSTQEDKLMQLANELQDCAFRIYTCDNNGFQTSPNIRWKNEQWEIQQSAKGKNWSWRPYYLLNIIKM